MRDEYYNIIVVMKDRHGQWGHRLYVDEVPNPEEDAKHIFFPEDWFPEARIIQNAVFLGKGFVIDLEDSKLYHGNPGQKAQTMESVAVPEELRDVVECIKMFRNALTYGDVADILTERSKK